MTIQKNVIPVEDLIEILNSENPGNFKEIVRAYQSYVYSVAFRLMNNCNDAEDIVQECFIRVWKNKARYNKEVKFTTWLYRIVVNICYDQLKSRKRRISLISTEAEMDQYMGSSDNPALKLDKEEASVLILKFTEELSYKQKIVFTLRDLEQLSVAEVADIMEISEESVKTNLVYARRAMKEKIVKYYKQGNL